MMDIDLLAKFVGDLLSDESQCLRCVLGGDGVGRGGDRLERFDGADLVEDVGAALALLDAGLHAEVEGGQVARLFPLRVEDGHQTLEPVLGAPLPVSCYRVGELVGVMRRYERLHLIINNQLITGIQRRREGIMGVVHGSDFL